MNWLQWLICIESWSHAPSPVRGPMSAATAGSVCLANPAVLPRPIELLGSPYQSKPSPGFTEIFGGSAHLQKFPDKPAEWPHH